MSVTDMEVIDIELPTSWKQAILDFEPQHSLIFPWLGPSIDSTRYLLEIWTRGSCKACGEGILGEEGVSDGGQAWCRLPIALVVVIL